MSKHLKKFAALCSVYLTQTLCSSIHQNQSQHFDTVQIRANNPIEDRFCYGKLTSIQGYTASVFDGHGGDLVSQYASKHMNLCIDQRLKQNKYLPLPHETMIEKSLIEAYYDIQNGFYSIFRQHIDNKAYQRVGSCALTAVILKNSIIVANSGDCQGVLLSSGQPKMVNKRFNAGQKFEQQRLVKQFPGQDDIYTCIPNTNYCYVKGRLQPTRSLGDFYLKFKQHNFTKLKTFTGPYVQYKPDITHFKYDKSHTNLVLATDGLWDELNEDQIDKIFKSKNTNSQTLSRRLLQSAIDQILKTNKIPTFEQLMKIDYRRDLHDDITIININLETIKQKLA